MTSTLDLGAARIRYADSLYASVVSVTPTTRVAWQRASAAVAGTYARFGEGGWSINGDADLSVFSPPLGTVLGELAAAGGGSAQDGDSRTGRILAVGRAHAMGRVGGLWAGAGVGRTYDGQEWRGIRLLDGGAWVQVRSFTGLATVEPSIMDDTIRYTDTNVAVRWEGERFEVGASGGMRTGRRLPALGGTAKTWGSASVAIRATNLVAVVASGGSYPVDLTQGFPGGRYASLAIRLQAPGWAERAAARSGSGARGADTGPVHTFAVEREAGDEATIVARAPTAEQVEISGDFTGWRPMPLRPDGNGQWRITLAIVPGTHQVNVRVNGGPWLVPPGLTSLRDEFGGAVGLLVVPAARP